MSAGKDMVPTNDGRAIDVATVQYEDSRAYYFSMIGNLNSRIENARLNPTGAPREDVKHLDHLAIQRDDFLAQYYAMHERYVDHLSDGIDILWRSPGLEANSTEVA